MRSQVKMKDMLVAMEAALILDKYTEHCSEGLAYQWDQVEQTDTHIWHSLKQQMAARNTTGMINEALK